MTVLFHVLKADSVAWALSKMLGMSQQCAAFLSKWPMILVGAVRLHIVIGLCFTSLEQKQTNASNADYLFHDDDTKPFDLGDKTINCGRRQDSFKIWLSWRVHGDEVRCASMISFVRSCAHVQCHIGHQGVSTKGRQVLRKCAIVCSRSPEESPYVRSFVRT